jgi:hypothetical protein
LQRSAHFPLQGASVLLFHQDNEPSCTSPFRL